MIEKIQPRPEQLETKFIEALADLIKLWAKILKKI